MEEALKPVGLCHSTQSNPIHASTRSVEYSHHEFRETGFSPILAGNLYCEEDGLDEEQCYLFEEDEEEEDEEEEGRVLRRRASAAFRRPASRGRQGEEEEEEEGGAGYGNKLYVTGVMVAACCRRQGLGAGLLRAVEEHAQVLRTQYIVMFVEPTNTAALALYTQKAGFHMVPYSPTAEAFAAAIGLYKGPYAARQYAFVYKRLKLKAAPVTTRQPSPSSASSISSSSSSSGARLLTDAQAAALPFPGRMPALSSSFFS